ncbi:MAG: hypothetical protein CM15mP45_12390 [Deltaproteobacteria bacterium]|nr:MAG: hypothetical protein CM15mP45_12390 [Deltaproteobacteria bacterium]
MFSRWFQSFIFNDHRFLEVFMLGGYANKIGFVNLSAGSVELKDSPEDWKLKYVGGRGMGVKYVLRMVPGWTRFPRKISCVS